jgi:hypothetical protein
MAFHIYVMLGQGIRFWHKALPWLTMWQLRLERAGEISQIYTSIMLDLM